MTNDLSLPVTGDTSTHVSKNLQGKLDGLLQRECGEARPDFFQLVKWYGSFPTEFNEVCFFGNGSSAKEFRSANQAALTVTHSLVQPGIFTRKQFSDSHFFSFFEGTRPFGKYYFLPFSDNNGERGLLTMCFRDDNGIAEVQARKLLEMCMAYISHETTVHPFDTGLLPKRNCGITELTHAYLQSLDDISSRFSKALQTQYQLVASGAQNGDQSDLSHLIENISFIRSRGDLEVVLKKWLERCFDISGFLICLIDFPGHSYSAFIIEDEKIDPRGQDEWEFQASGNVHDKISSATGPIFFRVAEVCPLPCTPSFFRIWKNFGVKSVIGYPLFNSSEYIGCLFYYSNHPIDSIPKPTLLSAAGSRIAQAICNVRAFEILQSDVAENALTCQVSRKFSQVRSIMDLTGVLERFTSNVFHSTGYAVAIFEHSPDHFKSFIGRVHDAFDTIFLASKDAGYEEMCAALLPTGEIKLFDLIEQDNFPAPLARAYRDGARKMALIPLQGLDKQLGLLMMFFQNVDPLQGHNGEMMKHLSAALVSTLNALYLQDLEQLQVDVLPEEKELPPVKSYSVLKGMISQELKKIKGAGTYLVLIMNGDLVSWRHLLIGTQTKAGVIQENSLECAYPINDRLFEAMLAVESHYIYDIKQIKKLPVIPDYVNFWSSLEMDFAIALPLRTGSENIGMLMIGLQPGITPEPVVLRSAKKLSLQVSRVVASLDTNDALQCGERELKMLLSLNTAIATAADSQDLERIIKVSVKQLLNFKYTCIGRIDQERNEIEQYLTDIPSHLERELLNDCPNRYPLEDTVIQAGLLGSFPVIFNVEEIRVGAELPSYLPTEDAEQLIVLKLASGGRLFGIWMIFFEACNAMEPDGLGMMQAIADQIAVAMLRIEINEDIQRRENEKTQLLEFSNAIASVREKNLLAHILRVQLKALFDIDDYIVHSLSEDKKYFTPLLFEQDAVFSDQPEFLKQLDSDNEINDGIFNVTLSSREPVIHDMEEIALRKDAPEYMAAAKAVMLKKMVGVALRIGEEAIAVMNFRLEDVNQIHIKGNLFKSICSQLAIAVANIIANEKVIKQLREIDSYKQQLEEERIYLKEEISTNQHLGEIIGESKAMQESFRMVAQVAPSDSTVLILGETGTGKELIARAIHNNSPRHDKLMVKVNCAALPANLIESELFGHERGSFTGATERRIGKFELANNGTLFLDEIGEMPLELQVKLLRALQEKEIERIGGKNTIKVNVRIIAATNRDLEREMEEGRFRSDLYYRLNIFPIHLAPLRDRLEDIPLLALHFINRYSKKTGKKMTTISAKVLQELTRYSWPGNIRELEHLLERSVLLSKGDSLKQVFIPGPRVNPNVQMTSGTPVIKTINENERDHILQVLKHCRSRVAGEGGAAQLLGIPASTLNSKIKKLGIRREHLL